MSYDHGAFVALAVMAVAAILAAVGDAAAQQGRRMPGLESRPSTGDGSPSLNSPFALRAPREVQEKAGLIETGLQPIYPREVTCPEVASPFGSPMRFDGSSRRGEANNGVHAGMDISSPVGTPLLAIADGVVIHKREGGLLAGIQIFLQHSPADTGFSAWLYSKYQHLGEHPKLEAGERVKAGQVIGLSGNTGTVGGHYGASGYPHLHLALYAGSTADFADSLGGPLPVDGHFLDPLAIYTGKALDNHVLRALPEPQKHFIVPYKTSDGRLVPAGTRVVWPYVCQPR